jgi:hypothetical protein
MSDLLTYFQNYQQQMVDFLTKLISYETPTTNKALVDKLGSFIENECRSLGANVTRIPQEKAGDFLLAKWNENAPGKPIMFLIHADTVWPEGTLAERMEDVAQLFPNVGLVQDVVDFIRNASARGVCQPLPDGPKSA